MFGNGIRPDVCFREARAAKERQRKTHFPTRRGASSSTSCGEGCGECKLNPMLSVEPLERFRAQRKINRRAQKDTSASRLLPGSSPSRAGSEERQSQRRKHSNLPRHGAVAATQGARIVIPASGRASLRLAAPGMARIRSKVSARMAGLARGGACFARANHTTPEDCMQRASRWRDDVVLGVDLIVTASNEALSQIKSVSQGGCKHGRIATRLRAQSKLAVRSPTLDQIRSRGHVDCAVVDANALLLHNGDASYKVCSVSRGKGMDSWPTKHCSARARSKLWQSTTIRRHSNGAAPPRTTQMVSAFHCGNMVELKRFQIRRRDLPSALFSAGYQNAAYAKTQEDLVERVRKVESDRLQSARVTEAVARYYSSCSRQGQYEVAAAFRPGLPRKDRGAIRGDTAEFYWSRDHQQPDPVSESREKRFGRGGCQVHGARARKFCAARVRCIRYRLSAHRARLIGEYKLGRRDSVAPISDNRKSPFSLRAFGRHSRRRAIRRQPENRAHQ